MIYWFFALILAYVCKQFREISLKAPVRYLPGTYFLETDNRITFLNKRSFSVFFVDFK